MVEFELPEELTPEFMKLVPQQRSEINKLFAEGKLRTYSLALDRSVLWAVFLAESEFEILEIIADFPLAEYMTPYISELMFHNNESMIMQISLN